MLARLFIWRTVVDGQEITEPTPLAIGLTALGLLGALGAFVLAVFFLYPHGQYWVIGGLLAVFLAWLLRRRTAPAGPSTRCRAWLRRVRGTGRKLFAAVAACWLGLLVWLHAGPGGSAPPPKEAPEAIRVVSWNVLCGQDDGPFWKRSSWAARKHALETALRDARPDILCVQEARHGQIAFLECVLPGHERVGVGRDDGGAGGEHCAILFDRARFVEMGGGTFWLVEPTDRPAPTAPSNPRRICTWVRLHDRSSGRTVRVYNTHSYLTEEARHSAACIILERMATGDPSDAVILMGDFNAAPSSPTMHLFAGANLVTSSAAAGKSSAAATYHFYGIPLRCLDAIFVNPSLQVRNHVVLNAKPGNTYPSDHFGVLADVTFRH